HRDNPDLHSFPTRRSSDLRVYPFDDVEVLALYPGGLDQFRKEVSMGIVYPQAAIDAGVKGKIEVLFMINREGEISNISVLKDIRSEEHTSELQSRENLVCR